MDIAGIQHFSLLDYPGKISAIIFTQGCPFRCIYCHNRELQSISAGHISFIEVLAFLKTRVGLLEGIVFSGGEPLMQYDLYDAMMSIKDLGFNIGLHTSGAIPTQLDRILSVVDWVGFDIKTTFDNYDTISRISNSGSLVKKSFFKLLKHRDTVDFEIRTTVDSRFVKFDDLIKIAKFLKENNINEWTLQQCILRYKDKDREDISLPLPNDNALNELKSIINVKVRN